jgi:enoyl-CoA hydratase/carnithine racemase
MKEVMFETIEYSVAESIATITLNRPQVLNAFNSVMCEEVQNAWTLIRQDDSIHVAVLRAAGARAFCSGMDRIEGVPAVTNPWNRTDPGTQLSPKSNHVWKPVVCAVQGMCAGGAFYFLNTADIIICDESATFFDPHVSYGMTSALEAMGLARRIPIGEVLRWALLGLDERISASRALQIGLVSEVVPRDQLHERATDIARSIAMKPAAAIQGTVKAIWEGMEVSPSQAQMIGLPYTIIGNESGVMGMGEIARPEPRIR